MTTSTVTKKNAYQLAQALAKAIRESEIGEILDAKNLVVWSAAEHASFSGYETSAPALCWEEGPYEWAVGLTGWEGERLSDEENIPTDAATRKAYAALAENGYYAELTNSFVLAIYPR